MIGLIANGQAVAATDPVRPPNMVLIMADDLGWGDVAYNGNPVVLTPRLDAMARESLRLDRFYAAAPVCSPTRGSCLTGRHPSRYGMDWASSYPLPLAEATLPESLKPAGYRSGHFGKWHLGTMTADMTDGQRGRLGNIQEYSPPWNHGFDVCFSAEVNGPTYNPSVWGRDDQPGNPFIMNRAVEWGETTEKPGVKKSAASFWTGPGVRDTSHLAGDSSEVIMDRAIDFIEAESTARTPFLAVIWFFSPHTPVSAGDTDRAPYAKQPMEAQHWYGCITAMDRQIGRLRTRLRELNIADNTIVWFCSDNGPSWTHTYNSAGPFGGKKGSLHEGGIRVPALLEWPARFRQSKVIDAPVGTVDFYPTLLACAGVRPAVRPGPLDGRDVLPLLDGTVRERSASLMFQSPSESIREWQKSWDPATRQQALIGDRLKLMSEDGGKSYALYDLIDDKSETTDVAATHPEEFQAMRRELESWIESSARSRAGADYGDAHRIGP